MEVNQTHWIQTLQRQNERGKKDHTVPELEHIWYENTDFHSVQYNNQT